MELMLHRSEAEDLEVVLLRLRAQVSKMQLALILGCDCLEDLEHELERVEACVS